MQKIMTHYLPWPMETAANPASNGSDEVPRWMQPASNISLDFHGDPLKAKLVVFSDGNHHMALLEVIRRFQQLHPNVQDVFYATTPPGVLLDIIKHGAITLGNLSLSRQPHVFISPEFILQKLFASGAVNHYPAFMRSCGNVMLVRHGNPKGIENLSSLLRDDVTLFLSNPKTETASYQVYRNTLLSMARLMGIDTDIMQGYLDCATSSILYGERIHHREAPQYVYDGRADVAVVYYHLALRYSRIFPEQFSIVPLTGEGATPADEAGNEQTTYYLSTMKAPGEFGQAFVAFCLTDEVAEIYRSHGLQRPA